MRSGDTAVLARPRAGAWEILERIGGGGQATVHRARHREDGRVAAVKLVHRALWSDSAFRTRFRRECDALAALSHPNVVPVLDAGEAAGRGFLVMPLARDGSLAGRLRRGPLEEGEALWILEAVAGALDAAHAAGLLHRDVTPDNVLLDPAGPWLADFGLARRPDATTATGEGLLVGTAGFLAPEVIQGGRAGPASDRYALAALAFRALAGRPPFEAEGVAGLLYAHVRRAPPRASSLRPALPRAVDAVLARGLAKRPADRPGSARALVDGLRRALAPPGREATRVMARPRRRRRRAAAALVAGGLVAAGAAGAALTVTLTRPGPPPAPGPVAAPAPPARTVPGPDGAAVAAGRARAADLPGLRVVPRAAAADLGAVRVAAVPGGWDELASAAAALDGAGHRIEPLVVDERAVAVRALADADLTGRLPVWVLMATRGPGGPRALVVHGPLAATEDGYAAALARSAGAALVRPPEDEGSP